MANLLLDIDHCYIENEGYAVIYNWLNACSYVPHLRITNSYICQTYQEVTSNDMALQLLRDNASPDTDTIEIYNTTIRGKDYAVDRGNTTLKIGTATATQSFHLIDNTLKQFLPDMVGREVINTTTGSYVAVITAYDSASDVRLSDDIMTSGQGYEIIASKTAINFSNVTLVSDDWNLNNVTGGMDKDTIFLWDVVKRGADGVEKQVGYGEFTSATDESLTTCYSDFKNGNQVFSGNVRAKDTLAVGGGPSFRGNIFLNGSTGRVVFDNHCGSGGFSFQHSCSPDSTIASISDAGVITGSSLNSNNGVLILTAGTTNSSISIRATNDTSFYAGYKVGQYTTSYSGQMNNVGIGNGVLTSMTTNAQYNNAIGWYAGYNNTTGTQNNFMGYKAGYNNTAGSYNIDIGSVTGFYNQTGGANVIIGFNAGTGKSNNSASYNTLIGEYAAYACYGNYNTTLGWNSGYNITTSNWNTYIGAGSGRTNTTGSRNVAIGDSAGYNNVGSSNVFIGPAAGTAITTASNLFVLANAPNTELIYGNFATGQVGINTSSPDSSLTIAGGFDLKQGGTIGGSISISGAINGNIATAPVTVRTGSASVTVYEPFQGTSYKKVGVYISSISTSTHVGIAFPTAFTNIPGISVPTAIVSGTTSLTVPPASIVDTMGKDHCDLYSGSSSYKTGWLWFEGW